MEQIVSMLLAGSISLLLVLLAWIGSRLHDRLDAINSTLLKIDADLTEKISRHDVRLAVLEGAMKHRRSSDEE